jgi:hypothetical protein
MPEIKRLHYFNQQFLTEKDFKDEQAYHMDMRRRLNRELHTSGIAEGFEVEQQGPTHILVRPGFAIDRHGREVILSVPEDRDLAPFGRNVRVFVSVQYVERMAEDDRQTGASHEDYTRVTEVAEVIVRKQEPDDDDVIPLAVVTLDGAGRIESVDPSVRRPAGPYVPPGSIRTEHLADGCITPKKLSRDMELVSGWVRQCFKPHPVKGKAQYEVGMTEAVSGSELASGSMGMVSPPGARRALEFVVAGERSGNGISAVLYRCGWNDALARHDREELIRLEHKGEGKTGFRVHGEISADKRDLDTRYNALSVSIESSLASVSLVAVRFEYQLDA